MKNKRAFIISSLVIGIIAVVISLCVALVPNMVNSNANQTINYSYGKNEQEKTESSEGDSTSNTSDEKIEEFTYFINSQNAVKTMEISGETKIFTLSFSLFAKNNLSSSTKILFAGYEVSYGISEYGTFLTSSCTNHDSYVLLSAGEITELKFEAKYVITEKDFSSLENHTLTLQYFGNEIYQINL